MKAKIDGDFIEVMTRIKRTRHLKVAYNKAPGDGTLIPSIRFSGTFLEDLGFAVQASYTATVEQDGSITLRVVEEEGDGEEGAGLFGGDDDDD